MSLTRNHGCAGGWYYWAWDYLEKRGQMSEKDYPFIGTAGSCEYFENNAIVKTTSGGVKVREDSDSIMAAILIQPVSVAISANSDIFRTYKTGVITSADCSTALDHAVAVVGFNYDATPPYYIVKNSWNTIYGDKGYVKIAIADGYGICGINQKVYTVQVKPASPY